MFGNTMYPTPEGFTLPHPLLLPDARSFSDVLEYVCEWDLSTHDRPAEAVDAIRYYPETPSEPPHEWHSVTGRNEIGPYCNIDLSQLGGLQSRSMVVRATDAVMEATQPRMVTSDDHLSFRLIAHKSSGRVLVILNHGYIIGSHWLAYIDPATIPAYPFTERDAAGKRVRDEIKASGHDVMSLRAEPHHRRYQGFTRTRETGWTDVYHGSPVTIGPDGVISRQDGPRIGDRVRARDLPAGAVAICGTSSEYVKCSRIECVMRWEQPIPGSGDWIVTYAAQLPEGETMTETEKREVEATR